MDSPNASKSRGPSLHTLILLGLVLGAICGIAANQFGPDLERWWSEQLGDEREIIRPLIVNVMRPIGSVFLNLLFMTVVPLVFASLAVGVAQLGDLRSLGRIGIKTLLYFVLTMTCAVVIGLVLVNAIQPGSYLNPETRDQIKAKYEKEAAKKTQIKGDEEFGVQTFVNIVPRNPLRAMVEMDMLAVICFALLIGIGLTIIPAERAKPIQTMLEGVGDLMVFIINFAMMIAPLGVFGLIFSVTAEFGFDIVKQLALYVIIVLTGLGIQMFGVLSILVWLLSGINPLTFFIKVRDVIITAFTTSSSNATLPTTIKITHEELGVPPKICGFVLPLGATMNMNGTALFEGVTVVFLAQVFRDTPLSMTEQVVVVVLSVLTAIGAAGVPGGSLPLLAMILSYARVAPESIALILGVDRLLDMCRTTLNVVGDITAATYIARSEGYALKDD